MKTYKENDAVIYSDPEGRQIDTFVLFDTDGETGLTPVNHKNLKVPGDKLMPHPKAIPGCHLPFADASSFEIFRKLREKEQRMAIAKYKAPAVSKGPGLKKGDVGVMPESHKKAPAFRQNNAVSRKSLKWLRLAGLL